MTTLTVYTRAAIAHMGRGIISGLAVEVYGVQDPRIKEGAYFEKHPDGRFYCETSHDCLLPELASEMIDFLVANYPSETQENQE